MSLRLEDPQVKSIGRIVQLPLADLMPDPKNANRNLDIKGLAQSIAELGYLLHPMVVRKHPEEAEKFLIVAGERRWRALNMLKAETGPCVILNNGQNEQSGLVRLVENHQRLNLTPLEEAAAVRALLEEGHDVKTVARSLGRSSSWVVRRASLTELSDAWLKEIKGVEVAGSKIPIWPPSHLEIISRFPVEVQDRMLAAYCLHWRRDIPTMGELIQVTGEYQHLLAAAPWTMDDATLCPEVGSCALCPKRTAHHPELFPEDFPGAEKAESDDRCLDQVCWDGKAAAYLGRRVEEVRQTHPNCLLLDASEEGITQPVAERLSGPIFRSEEVASCRKSDPNALPAVIVAGPGLGRLKYVQGAENGRGVVGNGHNESRNTPKDETTAVLTLAERQERYDKRRRQMVIDNVHVLIQALSEAESIDSAQELPGGPALVERGLVGKTLMLAVILILDRGRGRHTWPSTEDWRTLDRLKNHDLGREEVRDKLLASAWLLMRELLTAMDRLLSNSHGQNRNNDGLYANAELFCKLLALDLNVFRAEAAEAIPYAQGWREQVTDEWIQADPTS